MNELTKENTIENRIYTIRGMEVMIDSDLAEIYECANGTKTINLAVKRNKERFPEDFYFQLNEEEYEYICGFNLKPQNNMSRTMPYAFTEQGVAMLASVLRTKVAAQTSVNIMRAFVHMRHYIKYNKEFLPNRVLLLEDKVDNNTKRIDELFDKFDPKVICKNYLYFEGEFFDANQTLLNIFESSLEEIIIIDNYAGKELLNILKDLNRRIVIVTKNLTEPIKEKYQKQYKNVEFIENDTIHDRFIIIDRTRLYHCGASFKDLGKKCFALNEINSLLELSNLLDHIKLNNTLK